MPGIRGLDFAAASLYRQGTMAYRSRPSCTYDKVWKAVERIPSGCVATYGMIARGLGLEGRARFVGYALHGLPPGSDVPWHRVVGAGGKISLDSHAGLIQRRLLKCEGIRFTKDRIDLERFGWRMTRAPRRRD